MNPTRQPRASAEGQHDQQDIVDEVDQQAAVSQTP
jgi:hypothetical protein